MYIFILLSLFSFSFLNKYYSDYYNNVTNILNKFPKVDIDYIFSKSSSDNDNKDNNNPSFNLFRNIFYDYYQTSVPLYDEKMKCYFPLKKNISLKLDKDYDSIPKKKNISKFLGKYFLKSLKGKCEQFYVERWYYTLCPLLGAMQTLSYIKSQENQKQKEKQEVNYLGYELSDEFNNTIFLNNLDENTKKIFEKKYFNELMDIYEENLYDNNRENSKIIGIYNNFINFYGDKVFDWNKFPERNKIFKLEYKTFFSNEIETFSANILKVVNDHLILIDQALNMNDLIKIKKVNKIKILKEEKNKIKFYNSFFNQSFFLYDEYVYSSKINLFHCSNKNCFVTISNQKDNKFYKIETIIDPQFAILESSVQKNIKSYENERYCIFLENNKLYFYGEGDIEELTETEDPETLILFGENLNIENSDEILLLFNGTSSEFDNVILINAILDKFIRIKYQSRINATHYKVKMVNKQDMIYFEKQISLDEKYIIVKNNPKANNKNESRKRLNHTYYVLGNDKNISFTNRSFFQDIKESIIISDISKKNTTNNEEENKTKLYSIRDNQEFIVTFELSLYNENYKESYVTFCFSESKKCKKGDYEILFDLKNYGIIINQINDENNEPKAFTSNKISLGEKYGIIFMNSSFYINNYFGKGNNKGESEIILKYKINEEKNNINYLIIGKYKSKNIFINDIKFYNNVSFDIFKNIYIYNQKYLLDDNTIYIDTFEKGDYCEPIKAHRKVIINYICDEEGIYDLKLMNVNEDKKNICVYNYYAKSRLLCNPNSMMKNFAKFSPVKTYCYLDS